MHFKRCCADSELQCASGCLLCGVRPHLSLKPAVSDSDPGSGWVQHTLSTSPGFVPHLYLLCSKATVIRATCYYDYRLNVVLMLIQTFHLFVRIFYVCVCVAPQLQDLCIKPDSTVMVTVPLQKNFSWQASWACKTDISKNDVLQL